jgi:hypothetical protein
MSERKVYTVKYDRFPRGSGRSEWLNDTVTFDIAVANFACRRLKDSGYEPYIDECDSKLSLLNATTVIDADAARKTNPAGKR